MAEREDEFGRFVPLLRRIVILVAVIVAVPVVLWTITAFVRAYIGPPRLPTFHQLASSALSNLPITADTNSPASTQPTASEVKLPPSGASTTEAPAAAAHAHELSAPLKSSLLGDHPLRPDSTPSAGMPKLADVSPMPPPASTETRPEEMPATTAPGAPDAATANSAPAAQQPAAAGEPQPEAMSVSAPLAGSIPLPRRRPRVFALANGMVPVPRPRPDIAPPAPPPEATSSSAGPIDFLQSLFH